MIHGTSNLSLLVNVWINWQYAIGSMLPETGDKQWPKSKKVRHILPARKQQMRHT
jgi:hypothetical protein